MFDSHHVNTHTRAYSLQYLNYKVVSKNYKSQLMQTDPWNTLHSTQSLIKIDTQCDIYTQCDKVTTVLGWIKLIRTALDRKTIIAYTGLAQYYTMW